MSRLDSVAFSPRRSRSCLKIHAGQQQEEADEPCLAGTPICPGSSSKAPATPQRELGNDGIVHVDGCPFRGLMAAFCPEGENGVHVGFLGHKASSDDTIEGVQVYRIATGLLLRAAHDASYIWVDISHDLGGRLWLVRVCDQNHLLKQASIARFSFRFKGYY